MSEQAGDINSYTKEKKTTLDYLFLVGGWMVSSFSLVTVGLISYWAINIPEKSVNDLPIISALKEDIRVEPDDPGGKSFDEENLSIYKNLESDLEIREKNEITLIDVRDIRELWKEGTIEKSKHIPRGMLEFWLDPDSSYYKANKIETIKKMVLFCALGWRSALAANSLQEMGFKNVAHSYMFE